MDDLPVPCGQVPEQVAAAPRAGAYPAAARRVPRRRGEQELALAEDGLRISFDVSTVLSKGSGSVEVHYKLPLDQSVLGQLPVRGCQVRLAHAAEALLNPWRGSYAGGG